ncbi:hypothetical protein BC938DRAFT_473046 [Jimgerdemannia flammicorona]|uniref:K Homology domain-containing protein n=1 Tax=Jimgerdemannia flammicorona TaxID=994334 RepID=A0A433Q4V9_9FUNG|nr:hypothetical protein BC938DRAFT_473046 [Jimgerdemannia flammicorona]
MPQETIPVPANAVGLVIGKGGSNLRKISERTGANLQRSRPGQPFCLTITAPTSGSLSKACSLVRNAIHTANEPYIRPAVAFTVLDHPVRDYKDGRDMIEFRSSADSANVHAVGEEMYRVEVIPGPSSSTPKGVVDPTSILVDVFGGITVASGPREFCLQSSLPDCLTQARTELLKLVSSGKSDQVMLLLRFGRQAFYRVNEARLENGSRLSSGILARDWCSMKIGVGGVGASFENVVEEEEVESLEEWLKKEGFEETTTTRVGMHFISPSTGKKISSTLHWDPITGNLQLITFMPPPHLFYSPFTFLSFFDIEHWIPRKNASGRHRAGLITLIRPLSTETVLDPIDLRLMFLARETGVAADPALEQYLREGQAVTANRRTMRWGNAPGMIMDCVRYKEKKQFKQSGFGDDDGSEYGGDVVAYGVEGTERCDNGRWVVEQEGREGAR